MGSDGGLCVYVFLTPTSATGAWSDGSPQWKSVSAADKSDLRYKDAEVLGCARVVVVGFACIIDGDSGDRGHTRWM